MSELALAAFAAAADAHLVGEPRSARFAAFRAAFDEQAELARLAGLGVRFLGRTAAGFPRCCVRSTIRRRASISAARRSPSS